MSRRRWIADRVQGDQGWLLGPNANHLFRVLRVKSGQEFEVVADGTPRLGTVVSATPEQVEFHLGEVIESESLPAIAVYLSIFKFDRMEWALEKLTELGVTSIHPMITQRTEKHLAKAAASRVERWRKITHEASQQSRRVATPQIAEAKALKQAIVEAQGNRIVLAENEEQLTLKSALTGCKPPIAMAFGPEGGWTDGELEIFRASGWKSASLGHTILRAETAAIAAVSIAVAELLSINPT